MTPKEDERDQKDQKERGQAQEPIPPAASAVTSTVPNDEGAAERAATAEQFAETDPMVASGVGLVRVDGIDKRYVGLSPGVDPIAAETSGGLRISGENSTFQGINQIPFDPSIEIKDPTTGEFYYPAPGVTSWQGCELDGAKLIPDLADPPAARKSRSDNKKADDKKPGGKDREDGVAAPADKDDEANKAKTDEKYKEAQLKQKEKDDEAKRKEKEEEAKRKK